YIQEPDKAKGTNGFSFSQVLKMVKSKQSILFPILSLALIGMIISSNLVLFPIWSNQVHGWHALENSFIFSLFGLVIVLMQSIGVSLLSKKLGMNRIPTIASLLVFVSLILLSFSFERINLVYVGIILLAAGYGIISPVNTSIISLQINLNGQGTLMGILNFVKSIGELAGSIAIPIMYDFYGPKMLFPQMTVIAMLILILTISINRKRSHEAR
ncbi:MAG: MFS transporter, partial [bacterium]